MMKKILIPAGLVMMIIILTHCNLIYYGVEQGIGQLKIVCNSKSIDEMVNSSDFPDSLKQKLLLTKEIRQFAIDSLGLKNTKNYTTVYDQKGKPIVWVVMASEKYQIKPYYWKFPIVGKMPYKGYFKKKKAEKEKRKIETKGYDARIATVAGWSTLGYFKDPILSNVLSKSEGYIAELIIHEMLHSTVYIKGESTFNENLATFVGEEGAKLYLISKYGINSYPYNEYIGELTDERLFAEYTLFWAKKMDSLFATFTPEMNSELKDSCKYNEINRFISGLDTVNFANRKNIRLFQSSKTKVNNAFFTGYKIYNASQNTFFEEYRDKYNGKLKDYIKYLENKY